jgi:hypothetical protein
MKTELIAVEAELVKLEELVRDPERYYTVTAKPGNWFAGQCRQVLDTLQPMLARLGQASSQITNRWFVNADKELRSAQMPFYPHPSNGSLVLHAGEAGRLARRRDELKIAIGLAEGNRRKEAELIGPMAKRAIQAAGGTAKIIERVVDAQIVSDRIPESLAPLATAVAAAEAEHFTAKQNLERSSAKGISEETLASLRAVETAARSKLTEARVDLRVKHAEWAKGFILNVEAGDRSDCGRLGQLAKERPELFPDRFGAAIAACEPRRASVDQALANFTSK